MQFASTLIEYFVIALAAVLTAALLFPKNQKKHDWRLIIAFLILLTTTKAIELKWAVSSLVQDAVLVAIAATYILAAKYWHHRRRRQQDQVQK
jgi:nucleoside permease NupC